jgi:UDP-glucose 4-epimerase
MAREGAMRVLLTGDKGSVGREVTTRLADAGDVVSGFDIVDGHDVLDLGSLQAAIDANDVVVHLAAVDDPDPQAEELPIELRDRTEATPEAVVAVTVLGTLNVLQAARAAGHERVVVMSSVDALGVFLGQRAPDYLPIDDSHPTYPRTPYALAKRTAERMCAAFTANTGMSTICLRPPGIWTGRIFESIRKRWDEDPMNDRRPYWEYGAFIAIEDVAQAIWCAIHNPFHGHAVLNISSDDAALSEQTSVEAARSIHPTVPWRGGPEFEQDPFRTLLDNETAKRALGWTPRVRFRQAARGAEH